MHVWRSRVVARVAARTRPKSNQTGSRQWGRWWGVALASKVRRRYDRPERAERTRLLGTHFDGHFLQILDESHAGAGCEFYIDGLPSSRPALFSGGAFVTSVVFLESEWERHRIRAPAQTVPNSQYFAAVGP